MKKFILVLPILLWASQAFSWYCKDVASERNGDTINACGIGESIDEDTARKISLNNAYKELDLICSRSSDCADRALEIEPLRTDCKLVDTLYRCHRGISASITSRRRDASQRAFLDEIFVPKKVVEIDGRDGFINTSIVDFESTPSGATVYVDGVEVCTTPCRREINQGEHKILFEKNGFDLISKIYSIGSGRQTVTEELIDTYGYLILEGLPSSATVKIDNNEISNNPLIRLLPNQHVVTVISKYHQPWHKTFDLKRGEKFRLTYDAESLMAYVKISAQDLNGQPIEADIYVNGEKLNEKTPAVIQIPSGDTGLTLTYSGHKDLSFTQKLEAGEKAEIKKVLRPSNEKNWTFFLGIGWHGELVSGVKEVQDYSCCVYADVSAQYMLTRSIGVRAIYNYLSGSSSGTTYYSSENLVTEYVGHLVGFSVPVYFSRDDDSRLFFGPEGGMLTSTQTYNGNNTYEEFHEKFSQSYYGLLFGKEWIKESPEEKTYGGYILAGLRQFKDSDKSSVDKVGHEARIYPATTVLHVSIGVSVNF
jgi:hypothetical protein